MNVLSPAMAEEWKQSILHSFPGVLMGIPAYFFRLAPGPHEEYKIKRYWKHSN